MHFSIRSDTSVCLHISAHNFLYPFYFHFELHSHMQKYFAKKCQSPKCRSWVWSWALLGELFKTIVTHIIATPASFLADRVQHMHIISRQKTNRPKYFIQKSEKIIDMHIIYWPKFTNSPSQKFKIQMVFGISTAWIQSS